MSVARESDVGVVAALASEARCLGRWRYRADGLGLLEGGGLVAISGVGGAAAARAAQTLVQAGAGALLSWGVAGGLDPALPCGAVVLATAVIFEPPIATASRALERVETSASWRTRLEAALLRVQPLVPGPLLSSATLVGDADLKARLFRDTGAIAVDMESAAVAAVAARHGLPFMALRVIVDTAADHVPAAIGRAFGASALPRAAAPPLRSPPLPWLPLLSVPSLWPDLVRLGWRYSRARQALRDCARYAVTETVASTTCAST